MMGSYGIGPARIVAAAIEQGADDRGIVWPRAIAPWDVHVVGLGKEGDEVTAEAERIYRELGDAGIEALLDDRDAGPGEKFTDAELLGCPLRVTVGKRTLAEWQVETQARRDGSEVRVDASGAAARVEEILAGLD